MLTTGTRALDDFPRLAAELQEICGFEVELRLDGILRVAMDDESERTLKTSLAWQGEFGLQWLDSAACRDIEPRLSPGLKGGVVSPSEGSVSNQLLALALERAAEHHGASIRQRAPVVGFRIRGERVTGVRTPDGVVDADVVVLAAGARSGQIAAKLKVDLPVRPIRGQMIALGGMSQPIRHVVFGPAGYLVPRANGLVFAGATVEDVGFRRRTTKAGVRKMRSMAVDLVPQLAAATVHFDWAGLRPDTPDHLPIIGPLAAYPNVIAATGHYRNGILLGPLTGRMVAEAVSGGDWSGVPGEFSPARYGA
jgi:glycine oxidase